MNLLFLYLLLQAATPAPTPIPAGKACVDCIYLIGSIAANQLKWVAPVYPEEAPSEGTLEVKVRFLVDKHGDVVTNECLDSKIDPRLCAAAAVAVKQWKFTPFISKGERYSLWATETLEFYGRRQPSVDSDGNGSSPVRTKDPSSVRRLRISQQLSAGLLICSVKASYPVATEVPHIATDEIVRVVIDREGNVIEVSHLNGNPELAGAAIEAVRQWKYAPYLLNGDSIEVETTATVHFDPTQENH